MIRELESMIEVAEGWSALPTSPRLSLRIAAHLDALRREQRSLVRLLVTALEDDDADSRPA